MQHFKAFFALVVLGALCIQTATAQPRLGPQGAEAEPNRMQQWLLQEQTNNVYDTAMIEVRDQGKLIAAGIFDKGRQSIAGILNFYHPGYNKYSLGKYLMLLKIDYAIAHSKQWYYPGYTSLFEDGVRQCDPDNAFHNAIVGEAVALNPVA